MEGQIRKNQILHMHMTALGLIGLIYFKDQICPQVRHFYGIFMTASYFVFNITQYVLLYIDWGDVKKMTTNGGTALLYTTVVIKAINFIINNKKYFELITEMDLNMKEIRKYNNSKMNSILDDHIRQSTIITLSILALVGTSLTVFSFYLFTIFVILSEDGVRVYPIAIDTYFPFDNSKHYIMGYAIVQWISFLALVLVAFWNSMIIAILIYAKCELVILQYRLRNIDELLLSDNKDSVNLLSTNETPIHKFKSGEFDNCVEDAKFVFVTNLIEKHKDVIRFVEDLADLISIPMFLDFLMFAILLCAELFQVSSLTLSVELAITVGYLSSMFLVVFMYYWHANEILLESEELAYSAYESPWYSSSLRFRAAILLVMIRSQRPLVLKAGFYDMTLQTLITILRASYSSFTLVRQLDGK